MSTKAGAESAAAKGVRHFHVKRVYQNHLPAPPCGPYFQNVEILSSLDERLPEYRTSSLEKSFIWQPHFGPDLGVKLDLVDQESIVIPEKPGHLDAMDLKYLNASVDKAKDTRGKNYDAENKPWWLRNTTYMENNPFNVASRTQEDKTLKGKKTQHHDIFDCATVDQSFRTVQATVDQLVAKNKNLKLEWSAAFLPEQACLSHVDQGGTGKKRGIVHFDEDPGLITKAVPHAGGVGFDQTKRFKIESSVITNTRPCFKPDGSVNDKFLDVSLVAPETDEATQPRASSHVWVKDYHMETQGADLQDCFLLAVNEVDGHAYFLPITSRMAMRKLGPSASKPIDCTVHHETR